MNSEKNARTQRDLPPEVHHPSSLRGDESDAQLGFKFA
jgi:hypothetical protein